MIEKLKQLLLQRPFQPFEIVLADGSHLGVTRKFQVAVGLTRFTYSGERGFQHLSENQITDLRVETLET